MQYEKPQVEVTDFVALERIAAQDGPSVDLGGLSGATSWDPSRE